MPDFDSPEYTYRPWSLTAQAVQITADNARAVTAWCDGTLLELNSFTVEIRVPCWDRSKLAHLADWVVKESGVFEVYDTEQFHEHYRHMTLVTTDLPVEPAPASAPKLETGL
jgi:hypothetical protein